MRRMVTLVLGVLLVASGTALAQDRGDISAGYRFIRSDGVNFPKGWYFDVTGHVTDVVSIVGDVGGTYKSESATEGGVTFSADARIHTFMGGVKVRALMVNPNVVPFGQILFGAGNAKFTAGGGGLTLSESSTDPVMNLSGGLDVSGGRAVGVRAQVGWLRIFEDGDGSNAFQFSIGATIGF